MTRRTRRTSTASCPDYDSTRNEGFGKLTFTPAASVLLNVSYRDSKRARDRATVRLERVAHDGHAATSRGRRSPPPTARGSSTRGASRPFKYTHFANPTQGRPDNVADVDVSTGRRARGSTSRNLDTQGRLDGARARHRRSTAYNAFIQPLINRYGYTRRTA